MPACVVIATRMDRLGHRHDVRAQVPGSPILTIAVVAAAQVVRHRQQTTLMMRALGSLSERISAVRFLRRLHQIADGMDETPANVRKGLLRAMGS